MLSTFGGNQTLCLTCLNIWIHIICDESQEGLDYKFSILTQKPFCIIIFVLLSNFCSHFFSISCAWILFHVLRLIDREMVCKLFCLISKDVGVMKYFLLILILSEKSLFIFSPLLVTCILTEPVSFEAFFN